MLTWTMQELFSISETPAKWGLWGSTPAKQTYHIETDDLEAAHARLSQAGRDVSELRTGRKPGSRVFTVRDGTQNVPTLFIAHTPR